MALSIIGAGFGRTGTDSMRTALDILGLGPCHHMKAVMESDEQLAMWRTVANGETPDWERIFDGFGACVDWPSAFYWRELSAHYPDAKVLLTMRDSENWYHSMSKTICRVVATSTDPESLGVNLIDRQVFGGRIQDRDHAIAVYERSIDEVISTVPPDRLLIHNLGDGWEPLCEFTGKPVPDVPYPRSNSAQEFTARMDRPD